ncbi:isopentenyl-diphosphate delta-isomerase [Actinoplanes tereljensis]|uniref:Nudix hydrolase domain-containing protein n=1 Tax=Paractinoplanes tereljensis TaxID=571912 RepID=A0A919NUU8_9ACTN|nr:NUDIX domain-containing protein [Actinoplanes tereljensis]GIF24763.1 hypothetical protein Ate02nite_74930 [Actinoplanes tereljensis]
MPAPAPTAAVDIVDERNEPIGTAQRGEVLPQGLNFRTVHVIASDQRDEVLLQRLSASRDRHACMWGSSVAGYLHAGETYEAAADRRLQEELGVRATLTFVGVTPMTDEHSTKFIGVFLASIPREKPSIQDPEHVGSLRWLPLGRLLKLIKSEPESFTPTLIHVISFVASAGVGPAGR